MQVNILEAKKRFSQLIKAARAGEEVIIANRGEPGRHGLAVKGAYDPRHGLAFDMTIPVTASMSAVWSPRYPESGRATGKSCPLRKFPVPSI